MLGNTGNSNKIHCKMACFVRTFMIRTEIPKFDLTTIVSRRNFFLFHENNLSRSMKKIIGNKVILNNKYASFFDYRRHRSTVGWFVNFYGFLLFNVEKTHLASRSNTHNMITHIGQWIARVFETWKIKFNIFLVSWSNCE